MSMAPRLPATLKEQGGRCDVMLHAAIPSRRYHRVLWRRPPAASAITRVHVPPEVDHAAKVRICSAAVPRLQSFRQFISVGIKIMMTNCRQHAVELRILIYGGLLLSLLLLWVGFPLVSIGTVIALHLIAAWAPRYRAVSSRA